MTSRARKEEAFKQTMAHPGLTILQPNVSQEEPEIILGIDLGTTYSLGAFMKDGRPFIVRDESGDGRVPSAIAFLDDGAVEIGAKAKARSIADPTHTAYSIKRLIGRTLEDLRKDLSFVPYQIVEREMSDGRRVLHVRIDQKEHTPEELSSFILREVVQRAEQAVGKRIQKVVITVPAYFDETQRQATRDAGRIAGLDVVRIVNEPTAAALAYGLESRKEGKIAVYDFGGGTFDCSILDLQGGIFKVLSTHGDTHLGGDDVDRVLMQLAVDELGQSLSEMDPTLKQEIRDAAEAVKIALTQDEAADFVVSSLSYRRTVSRIEFEKRITPLIERTLKSCLAALRDAGAEPSAIDEVVLVGGSSRLPIVRRRVEELFGRRPHMEINPDEVVAAGAAVQGSILAGQLRQVLLLDITPLSLGIETMGGAVSRLIARNSTIPVQATERFTTFVDDQTGVDIHILQGERELARDCRSLGRFKLGGIPPMPAGLPQIDVTFLLDANGMLQVNARELRSNKQASIEIQPSQGLNRDEVERMIRESIVHGKTDFEERRFIDLSNKAETNLRATEKGLTQAGSKLASGQRTAVETAISKVRSSLESRDSDKLQAALDELDHATRPLAELLMDSVVKAEVAGKRIDDA